MISHIFVDLDDVFADFVSSAALAHGMTVMEFEDIRTPGQWNMAEVMGLTQEEFLKPILEQGPEFWLTMKAAPWARDLINLLNETKRPWFILTCTSALVLPNHFAARVKWCRRLFGRSTTDPIMFSFKHLLAGPGKLLIDEKLQNVKKFYDHGGETICFPAMGNHLHRYANNPLSYVKERLDALEIS